MSIDFFFSQAEEMQRVSLGGWELLVSFAMSRYQEDETKILLCSPKTEVTVFTGPRMGRLLSHGLQYTCHFQSLAARCGRRAESRWRGTSSVSIKKCRPLCKPAVEVPPHTEAPRSCPCSWGERSFFCPTDKCCEKASAHTVKISAYNKKVSS